MKPIKCETCFYGEIKINEGWTRTINPHWHIYLTIWCKFKSRNINTCKLMVKCEDYKYRPRLHFETICDFMDRLKDATKT